MSAQPPARLTEEEYLEIERATEFRNEYYDGHMYVMSGGWATHAFIIGNLMGALHNALREKPCRIASSDFRVRVPPERFYTYPDIVVVCDPIQLFQKDTLLNPVLLIEVLSPSTESRDRDSNSIATAPSIRFRNTLWSRNLSRTLRFFDATKPANGCSRCSRVLKQPAPSKVSA